MPVTVQVAMAARAIGATPNAVPRARFQRVDRLAFTVWKDGALIRSLSLSPDYGIQENLGEPLEFEGPFWAGEHPVEIDPDWGENQEPFLLDSDGAS